MIMAAQLSWLFRALAHGKLTSYLRGLASVIPLAGVMLRARSRMRGLWEEPSRRLQEIILQSESLARDDFHAAPGEWTSVFLKWYFRLF